MAPCCSTRMGAASCSTFMRTPSSPRATWSLAASPARWRLKTGSRSCSMLPGWVRPSSPNASRLSMPPAAHAASIGPGRLFPSRRLHITGWVGYAPTSGPHLVPGLFAVGEVACTGVHGANRLASNSLLESLVFAWRCAALLLHEDAGKGTAVPSSLDGDTGERAVHATLPLPRPRPLHNGKPVDRAALQSLMWNAVGIERSAAGLEAAATQLDQWQSSSATKQDLETANLLALARVMVAAALARRESRGAHFREDFPETSAGFQHSLVYCQETARAVTSAC